MADTEARANREADARMLHRRVFFSDAVFAIVMTLLDRPVGPQIGPPRHPRPGGRAGPGDRLMRRRTRVALPIVCPVIAAVRPCGRRQGETS